MLSPRTAILAAACLFAVYVVNSAWTAVAPKTSAARGEDSFGRGRDGYRGIYDVLEQLDVPVERRIDPPTADLPLDATLVLWSPSPRLVRLEPTYLHAVADWVQQGGRVVVASGYLTWDETLELEKLTENLEHYRSETLPALGLEGVEIDFLLPDEIPDRRRPEDPELRISNVKWWEPELSEGEVRQLGTLGAELPFIELEDFVEVRGRTQVIDANGTWRTLAAAIPQGRGEIVVVSDSTLLCNAALGRGDNSVWAVGLLTDGGTRRVLVDEFYHGLSVRGNAWWLLGQPQYALPAAAVVLLLVVATWRAGQLAGPPLEPQEPARRTIGEYLDAMSRFQRQGRNADNSILERVRDGILHRLTRRYGVSATSADWEPLLTTMERQDAERAAKLRQARSSTELALASTGLGSSRNILTALHDLSGCLAERK